MKSRLLTRLEFDIRGAYSHSAADCLRCERAACLASQGEGDAARRELAAVRERYEARRPRPSIYAWLNLAEGLIDQTARSAAQGRDKVARSHALSVAAGLPRLPALSAAWLAHFDALRHDAEGVARHAGTALVGAEPDHHRARARAALAVAHCYDGAGRFDLARPWYASAHRHATVEGDVATLGAILWHMAAARVATWRQIECGQARCGEPAAEPARHALASVESAALFDRLTGMRARSALLPILHAQVDLLSGRADLALERLDHHLAAALDQGMAALKGALLADRGWCRARAGRIEAARSDALAATAALALPGAAGDRALGHSRLAGLQRALGETEAATQQSILAARHWETHRAEQHGRVAALEREGLDAEWAQAPAFARAPAKARA